MIAYLNGVYLPLKEAKISPMDRGFLFGDGVYEGISAYNGKLFYLEDHVKRLNNGLAFLDLQDYFKDTNWREIIEKLLEMNTATQGAYFIYQQITRGYEETRYHVRSSDTEPTVFITLKPFTAYAKENLTGKTAVTIEDIRWQRCDIKCTSLLGNIYAYNKAMKQKADQALLVRNGNVTEAASNNFFIVKNNTIMTPPLSNDLLPGITRKVIIELIKKNQLAFEEKELSENEVQNADELFISGTTSEIQPITVLNGKKIGNGSIGSLTYKLFDLFNQLKLNPSLWV